MKKEDLAKKKFVPIHDVIKEIELAVAMVFLPNIEPELITDTGLTIGELPSWNPKGLDRALKKIYAPFVKNDGNAPDFYFYTPLRQEIYGEIVFRRTNTQAEILFGRNGEKNPFTFSKGKNHLNLRIYRNGNALQNWQFNPLFIRIEDDKTICLVRMLVNWSGDRVRIRFREPSNPPRFMDI